MSQQSNTQLESWVDAETVARHLGISETHVRAQAALGKLPASQMGNGRRKFWRFKLSAVDAAMTGTGPVTITVTPNLSSIPYMPNS